MKNLNVWVIDDDVAIGEMFVSIFFSENVCIKHFDSPAKTLAEKNERPDAYFIDYRMPEINGYELAQQLPQGINKYLVTGESSVPQMPEFTDVIFKPYKMKSISCIIKGLLEGING